MRTINKTYHLSDKKYKKTDLSLYISTSANRKYEPITCSYLFLKTNLFEYAGKCSINSHIFLIVFKTPPLYHAWIILIFKPLLTDNSKLPANP